jgi:hypothetical protein
MKALFPDAHEPTASADSGISGLVDICRENGIDVVRYPSDHWKKFSQVEDFGDEFKRELREATLLLSLGSFYWLKFFGQVFGVNALIQDEIRDGKPFIFQSVRGWEKYFSKFGTQPGSEPIQALFRLMGVTPTPLQVFTNDAGSSVGGGAVAFFRAGDNCFLNADVLGDSDAILLHQPNILGFGRGVYPVVETGPLHQLIDD